MKFKEIFKKWYFWLAVFISFVHLGYYSSEILLIPFIIIFILYVVILTSIFHFIAIFLKSRKKHNIYKE